MAVVHISEEEAAKDLSSILARAKRGEDISIDSDGSSVRLIADGRPSLRTGAEMIAILDALPGERGVMDENFAADVRCAMDRMRSLPTRPSAWD